MKQLKIVQRASLASGAFIWIYGWLNHSFNLLAVGMLLIFIQNIIFSLREIKERIIFLIFHGAIFTFLLARPVIGLFQGTRWWEVSLQAEENIRFVILLITLSLIALYIGGELVSQFVLVRKKTMIVRSESIKGKDFRLMLQAVSFVAFFIVIVFYFLQESEKLLFIRENNYLDYYSKFQSILPGYVHTLADFLPYSLCVYLATLPSKKRAFIPLLLYWISAIPALIVGVRNPIVLNSIFIFLYYFIRDVLEDEEKWIGRVEKILLLLGIPSMTAFMFAYAYVRSGQKIDVLNPFIMIREFFWAQGTTFHFIAMGYGHRLNLPHAGKNYTFGGIVDYIIHGRIGQTLWGAEALPGGNNLINAQESNSLAHNLSYVILKDEYLQGRGVGSSYLLENYLDFGYIGVMLFSIVLGALLVLAMYLMKKGVFVRIIVLMSLTTIFFAPRAEATGWLTFIVTMQFWLCIGACYLGAYICSKVEWINKILKKMRLLS